MDSYMDGYNSRVAGASGFGSFAEDFKTLRGPCLCPWDSATADVSER